VFSVQPPPALSAMARHISCWLFGILISPSNAKSPLILISAGCELVLI
jgi:hypothetical protein